MPNITGSITAQKKRYNNDFGLNVKDQVGNNVIAPFGYPNIVDETFDFSLSFSICADFVGNDLKLIWQNTDLNATNNCILVFIQFVGGEYYIRLLFRTSNTNFFYDSVNIKYGAENTRKQITLCYISSTNSCKIYSDGVLKDEILRTNTGTFANTDVGSLIGNVGSSLLGGFTLKDLCLFNRELTQTEITYIYEVGVLPSSTHESVQFHLPLNHVALIDGTDRLMLDVIENYNYAKTVNLSAKHGVMSGWTDDELGLNTGTSTFTAYSDFYTKVTGQNFSGGGDAITYKGEELRYYGLQFDSSSGHNLTIQGLNTAKTNGYTFLVAVANKTNAAWTSGQANIFSHIGTEGSSRQFQIEGSASNTGKALRIVFPSGSSTAGLDSYADNDFDNSKIQFASFALSPNQDYYLTYLRSSQTRGYGQASFNTNVNQSNSVNTSFPLSFGFNEITTPTTKIGYNGTDSLDGILCYFAIVEGLEDQAIIKRQFNNGLLSNPSDFERLGLNLAFFADLNNPFDDAGTIKIPDLGDNNLTVIADSDLDSTWSTLAGVQSSQVELKTLL